MLYLLFSSTPVPYWLVNTTRNQALTMTEESLLSHRQQHAIFWMFSEKMALQHMRIDSNGYMDLLNKSTRETILQYMQHQTRLISSTRRMSQKKATLKRNTFNLIKIQKSQTPPRPNRAMGIRSPVYQMIN